MGNDSMHLFFDLDGTLTDSSPGIVRCINHALAKLGLEAADEARLRGMIGTPLAEIFPKLTGRREPAFVRRAIAAYRERFNEVGIFENSLYPEIADALEGWHADGHTMRVVTIKPAVAAARVVEHFGVARFFAGVHGPAPTDRSADKKKLIGAALRQTKAARRAIAMIGDRAEDVLAARHHDIRAIAVGWGYGDRDELTAASPERLVESVADLASWISRTDLLI
jgi:phosphoglycolate phosphatase